MNQEQIGKFIAELRKEKNMTQSQLAEKMNTSDKSISRWENGKTMPDISVLILLSDELNVTLPELLNGKRMSKEELIKQKETIEKLIEYESNQQQATNKKASTVMLIGNLLFLIAITDSHFSYLQYVFTSNANDFIQGMCHGVALVFNIFGLYVLGRNTKLQKSKSNLIKNQ